MSQSLTSSRWMCPIPHKPWYRQCSPIHMVKIDLYVYLWTCCPFFLRILAFIVGPTSILGPQYCTIDQLLPREGHRFVSKVDPLIPPKFAKVSYVRCFSWHLGFGSHPIQLEKSRAMLEHMYDFKYKKSSHSTSGHFSLVIFLHEPGFSSRIPLSTATLHEDSRSICLKWNLSSATQRLKPPRVFSFEPST